MQYLPFIFANKSIISAIKMYYTYFNIVVFSESIRLDNILLHYTLVWVMFDMQKVQTVQIFPYNKQSSV